MLRIVKIFKYYDLRSQVFVALCFMLVISMSPLLALLLLAIFLCFAVHEEVMDRLVTTKKLRTICVYTQKQIDDVLQYDLADTIAANVSLEKINPNDTKESVVLKHSYEETNDSMWSFIDEDDEIEEEPMEPPVLLKALLERMKRYNKNQIRIKIKAVILVFTSIDALEKAVEVLRPYNKNINFPIWIRANVLPGPIDTQFTPVDGRRFFKAARALPHCNLSVGWTTPDRPLEYGCFTQTQIDQMLDLLDDFKIPNRIRFDVRAVFAADAQELFVYLAKKTMGRIYIFSYEGDHVNTVELSRTIDAIGQIHVDVDATDRVLAQLRFRKSQFRLPVEVSVCYTFCIIILVVAIINHIRYFWGGKTPCVR